MYTTAAPIDGYGGRDGGYAGWSRINVHGVVELQSRKQKETANVKEQNTTGERKKRKRQ